MKKPNESAMVDTIVFLQRAGLTRRYHAESVIKDQTVGTHSFNVAWLCCMLTNGAPGELLLLHALAHDAAEHVTGDIPAPTKRGLGIRNHVGQLEDRLLAANGLGERVLGRLDTHSAHVLKLADALDGVLYVLHERQMGNLTLAPAFRNYTRYVRELIDEYRKQWGEVFGVAALYTESVAGTVLEYALTEYGPATAGREYYEELNAFETKENQRYE